MRRRGKVTVTAVLAALLVGAAPAVAATTGTGGDVPSCAAQPAGGSLALIPVNDGAGNSSNPCLASQAAAAQAAGQTLALYVNGAEPSGNSTLWPASCPGVVTPACAEQYGENLALDDLARAGSVPGPATVWWVDVETQNTWSATTALDVAALQGITDVLRSPLHAGQVGAVGIYSSTRDWQAITGGDVRTFAALPLWSASPQADQATATHNCAAPAASFAGGPVVLTQFAAGTTDGDVICPPTFALPPKGTAEGKATRVTGHALPGSQVSLSLRQNDGTTSSWTTTADAGAQWTVTVPKARYSGTLTAVVSTGGANAAAFRVVPAVGVVRYSGGRCGVATSGSIAPAWPGMKVALVVKGGGSHPLAVKVRNGTAAWRQTVTKLACGRTLQVSIATSGKAGSRTYTQPLTTAFRAVRTR